MSQASNWQIDYAAALIRRGGVIAYPTESVWGLGCDPFNAAAVRRLLALKCRSESKGLIMLSGYEAHFERLLAGLTPEQLLRFREPQSRPTTWLIPDNDCLVPRWVKGKHSAVAIRVSQHQTIKALTRKLGHPLISTSANPSGSPTATSRMVLNRYFCVGLNEALAYILPGKIRRGGQAWMIKSIVNNEMIRV